MGLLGIVMLVLERRGDPVRGAEVSLEEVTTHACSHLNCRAILGEVRQMHGATG